MSSAVDSISCRAIGPEDLPAIVDLLQLGFARRGKRYWADGLQRLARHPPPDGFPQFGYMLQAPEGAVGVHLLISSQPDGPGSGVRCNVSSWFVKEKFRVYGGLLVARATGRKAATYTNIGPEPATIPLIEAQGFKQFGGGVFAALPGLAGARAGSVRLSARRADWDAASMRTSDLRLLTDHAAFGCLGLWCETRGHAQPLIFRQRRIKPGGIPCAQLIYCRSLEDLEDVAAPVTRFLAARGLLLTLVPANRPLRGVPGRFFPEKLPMYFKGAQEPPAGDLSYTEAALFGM